MYPGPASPSHPVAEVSVWTLHDTGIPGQLSGGEGLLKSIFHEWNTLVFPGISRIFRPNPALPSSVLVD